MRLEMPLGIFLSGGINPRASTEPQRKRVLVVEDEPLWQLMIERSLKRIDNEIEVRVSENVSQALEAIDDNVVYDYIIADHLLPGSKTGLDLWDILLKNKLEIPYVLISGTKRADFFEHLTPYRTETIPTFIEKPASVRELSDQLNRVLFSDFQFNLVDKKKKLMSQMKNKFFWLIGIAMIGSSFFYPSIFRFQEMDPTRGIKEIDTLKIFELPTLYAERFEARQSGM